jgi:hypothetical protein
VTFRTANEWPSMTDALREKKRPQFFVSDGIGQFAVWLLVTQWFRPIGRGLDSLRGLA